MMRELGVIALLAIGGTYVMAQSDTAPPKPQLPPGGSLSEKLEKSNGVVRPPPDVDPKMAKPAPNPHPNSMPVIPPPGAPGGRNDIEPK
ncbi:MAG: hypothetical protein KGM42_09325 [Hyphomicrobiales bacterium]|nr:hypothetical protein [Hyphomicrobiales bacterium]